MEDGGLQFFYEDERRELTLRFLGGSLKDAPIFEVRFAGVEGYSFSQNAPPYEIYGASVSPVNILLPYGTGVAHPFIVRSVDGAFDPARPIDKQEVDCVVARSVKWRWIDR